MEMTPENGIWAFLGSVASGVATYFATRPRKRTRAEDELTAVEGFQRLAEQQREEMDRLVERVEAADAVIAQLRDEAHDLRNRFTRLLGYVQTALFQYVAELHRIIRAGGGEPPPMPPLPDLAPAKKPTP